MIEKSGTRMDTRPQLEMWNGENYICILLGVTRCMGLSDGEPYFDENQIEVHYRVEDRDAFGVGSGEYVNTTDIKCAADTIREVLYHKSTKAQYRTHNDLMRISIKYDEASESYSFSFGMLDTVVGGYHITVKKHNLNYLDVVEYVKPFFEWEKQYPII